MKPQSTVTDFLPNPNITSADLIFPDNVSHLLPPLDLKDLLEADVSPDAKRLASDWFYHGLKSLKVQPKPGVDKGQALAHIKCILGSFQPKHEVKMAAVSYLIDLWFDKCAWEPNRLT